MNTYIFHGIESNAGDAREYFDVYIIIIIEIDDYHENIRPVRLGYSRDFVLYHTDVDESSSSDFANRLGEGINNTSVVIELLADFNINYPNGILN